MSVLRTASWRMGGLVVVVLPVVLAGCRYQPTRPWGYVTVRPTAINQASSEIPEAYLLDVGIAISGTEELGDRHLEVLGTREEIRLAECHFVPFHIKSTLESSSHWGGVYVVPQAHEFVDLKVFSKLVRSNGEVLQIKVQAVDAAGRKWLTRNYHAEALDTHYDGTIKGQREAYQDLYNTVANDLAAFKNELSPNELAEIRAVSRLKFARDFAPDAFYGYLYESRDGKTSVQRLPADDDPLMARIDMIRERDSTFVETMNLYYEGFYDNMWEAYDNWRRYNRVEQVALRAVEQEAVLRAAAGAMLIMGGAVIEVANVADLKFLSGIMVLGGGQVMMGGIDVSKQAQIHAQAIRELGESFSAEMQPTVVELQGTQYELTGTANEQYAKWRELLRRVYYEETGFGPPDEFVEQAVSQKMPADS